MFYKNRSYKFPKVHAKAPTLESLFNKVAGLQSASSLKKRPRHIGNNFLLILKNFYNTLFAEHFWEAVSVYYQTRVKKVVVYLKDHLLYSKEMCEIFHYIVPT